MFTYWNSPTQREGIYVPVDLQTDCRNDDRHQTRQDKEGWLDFHQDKQPYSTVFIVNFHEFILNMIIYNINPCS